MGVHHLEESTIKILGLDFETQCDQVKTTRITEVGAVLYEYVTPGEWDEEGTRFSNYRVLNKFTEFCYDASYPPQTEFITQLTGITDGLLKEQGKSPWIVMAKLVKDYIEPADVIFAHKIAFDKSVLEAHCLKLELELPKKEWICTLTNFPWPKKYTCHKLSHLAYEHGLMVDPRTLHRAMNDVELMIDLISGHYDLKEILEYARSPWRYLKIAVPGPWTDGGAGTGFAKQHGFSYEQVKGTDGPKWPKTWVTRVKTEAEHFRIGEAARTNKPPYRVDVIEGIN